MQRVRRIGLNLLYLVPGAVGGSEIYARNLIPALLDERPELELVVYVGPEAAEALARAPWADRVQLVRSPVASKAKPLRLAAELSWLPLRLRRDRVELLHSLGTTNPLLAPVPSVVTVLDVIYHHFPETFPAASRLGLRAIVPLGARRARRVIAISAAAAEDITQVLGLDRGCVDVVHLGFGHPSSARPTAAAELRERFDLGDAPVVLTISAGLGHKNLPRLFEAVAQLPDANLVVAGLTGLDGPELERRGAAAGIAERVRFTGWLTLEDLEGFYALARVFAYPTLIEGFGLPVLEAMHRQLPLACSDIPVLREVAGDAAEFFDPHSPESIAAALRRLLADDVRRAELIAAGDERWPEFTWQRCARETLRVYESALSTNRQ